MRKLLTSKHMLLMFSLLLGLYVSMITVNPVKAVVKTTLKPSSSYFYLNSNDNLTNPKVKYKFEVFTLEQDIRKDHGKKFTYTGSQILRKRRALFSQYRKQDVVITVKRECNGKVQEFKPCKNIVNPALWNLSEAKLKNETRILWSAKNPDKATIICPAQNVYVMYGTDYHRGYKKVVYSPKTASNRTVIRLSDLSKYYKRKPSEFFIRLEGINYVNGKNAWTRKIVGNKKLADKIDEYTW